MRSLPGALLDAQRSGSAIPYLKVVIHGRSAGVRRLAWSRLYSGGEPDGYHAAAMPGDGSLLRARTSGGRLYYQRVPGPGTLSDYSSWTDLAAAAGADVALAAKDSRALLFWVDPDGVTVKVRESVDNGATLGAPVNAAAAAGAVTWLAADVKANGDALVLYSVGGTVFAAKRASGSWSSPVAWTNNAASVTGLACSHQGDWNTVVCGASAGAQAYAWSAVFGDGFAQAAGTWSPLREIRRASPGSGVTFAAPFLARPDTFRLTFVEKFTGNGAYSRPQHTHTAPSADFSANLWREPAPFDVASSFGQALAYSATAAWLSTPSGVWRADIASPGLDVTRDVLEAEVRERPFGGGLRLVLRNDGGSYSGPPPPLRMGAEARVSPGYATGAGPLASDGPAFWINRIEHRTGRGEASVALEAESAWGLVASWRAREQLSWAAGSANVFSLLAHVLARCGVDLSAAGASNEASNLYPPFTVHPGESGLTVVRRLLERVPDVVRVRGESAFLMAPLVTEAATYAYGQAHAIIAGRYAEAPVVPSRVQVYGSGVFGERFDWSGIEESGDRLEQVLDPSLVSVAQAEARGDAVLRRAALRSASGEITVPVNCGQEVYDVVEVDDPAAGLVGAKRRVLGLTLRYSAARGIYEQALELGGV